jgi:hypothetical protein
MDASMQTVLNTLQVSDWLFLKGLEGLDDGSGARRIAGEVNPPVWLAGHLLNSRKYLLELFGVKRDEPFGGKFAGPWDPNADYPAMSEIAEAWKEISTELVAAIEQASDDHFETPTDWELPNRDKTVRGALLFYMYHEAWHLGQLAYARRGMGMEGMVGR